MWWRQGYSGTFQNHTGNFSASKKQKKEKTGQGEKTKISKSISTIHKVPKCHNVDGVGHIAKNLDSTLTGKCDADELAIIVWLLTRIRPDFKISDLRCIYYEDIFEKYEMAAARLRDQNPANFNLLLTKIQTFLVEEELDQILVLALEMGFNAAWLAPAKTKKKKASERMQELAKAAPPTRRRIHEIQAWAMEMHLDQDRARPLPLPELSACQQQLQQCQQISKAAPVAKAAAPAAAPEAAPDVAWIC